MKLMMDEALVFKLPANPGKGASGGGGISAELEKQLQELVKRSTVNAPPYSVVSVSIIGSG